MHRLGIVLSLVGACTAGERRLEPARSEPAPAAARIGSPGASIEPEPPTQPRRELVDVRTEWCVDGVRGLDEDACYVPGKPGDRTLLVYLHGIVPPEPESPQKTTVEGAVREAAERAGITALIPRGRSGLGPTFARTWWAWPTAPDAHTRTVDALVARWGTLKKKLEAQSGVPFTRTYLAGSSNGAYFLAALALRGDCDRLGFPVDGYAAISGGAPGGLAVQVGRTRRPVYVGYGLYDGESPGGAKALALTFESAHWPVKRAPHPLGHGAHAVYLDEALAFFDASLR